jgi:ribosomal protein S18 acetylase RimI-like enzyme
VTTHALAVKHFGSTELPEHRDELLRVYGEVYADRLHDPFFSIDRYWERLTAYAKRDGFSVVTGQLDGALVGYALGYTLPAGSQWWQGLRTHVDPALLEEDGHRTFALTEIMTRAAWRRRGYARVLHDTLMTGRPESRATLLVLPDNVAAQRAYASWGWYRLGPLQPFDDAPVYDAMVLDLAATSSG